MTYPITPNPGIHNDTYGNRQATIFAEQQLAYWAEQLPAAMTKLVVEAIIRALDGVLPAGWQQQLQALETALAPVQTTVNNLVALLEQIFGFAFSVASADARIVIADAQILTAAIKSVFGNTDLGADVQAIVTDINTALGFINGVTGTLSTDINDIQNALKNIPGANMLNVLGGANIADDLQQWSNSFVSNISTEATGTLSLIKSWWPHFTGFVGYQPSTPAVGATGSVYALAQTQQKFQQGQATAKPVNLNIDPSVDGVFNLSTVASLSSLPSVAVTQGNSVVGFILTPDGNATAPAPKIDLAWIGYPSGGNFTNITAIYLNVYQMDTAAGGLTLIQQINITNPSASTLTEPTSFNPATGSAWQYYPMNATLPVQQGQVYAVELSILGSGTYYVAGLGNALPVHPTVFPKQWGATRVSAPTVNFAATLSTAIGGASVAVPLIGNIPAYNATGAGYSLTTSASSLTTSYTHTVASGMSSGGAVIVYVITDNGYISNLGTAGIVKYGSSNMTYLSSVGFNNNGNYGAIYAYGITGVTGSATVSVTSMTFSASIPAARIQSVSYSNVTAFGAVVTNYWGSTTAATSGAVATAQTQMVSQCFAAQQGATLTFGSYTQTSRENSTAVNGSNHLAWVIGDTPVAAPPSTALAPNTGTGSSPFTYSATTPWFGLSGIAPAPSYPPELTTYSTAGTTTYTVPSWANYLDVIAVGGGGAATTTTSGYSTYYNGGGGGTWNAQTWSATGLTTVGVTVGSAGNPSSVTATGRTTVSGAAGAAGATTQAAVYNSTFRTYTSPGDHPQDPLHGNAQNKVFDGNTYYGGAASSGAGNSPGGGAAGFGYGGGSFSSFAAAPGAVFILAYQ